MAANFNSLTPWMDQLQGRKEGVLEKVFQSFASPASLRPQPDNPLILTSPTDLGVCRNGGRRGAQFAPQAILAPLRKMNRHAWFPQSVRLCQVSDPVHEEADFEGEQLKAAERIGQAIAGGRPEMLLHLGGGHDHVFPLLLALEKLGVEKLAVINIDAHCDTRTDQLPHSGTPFRQFALQTRTNFQLYQLGIHEFANHPTTLTGLSQEIMHLLPFQQIVREAGCIPGALVNYLSKRIPWDNQRVHVLSLDCDVLESPLMEGVSAVNHHGLTFNQLVEIFHWYLQNIQSSPRVIHQDNIPKAIMGFYEYNPVYDNLSQKGARALSSLIYQVIHSLSSSSRTAN